MNNTMPRVAIVGRMNVGKSTLFNRLSSHVKSLTLDYEGVTRDFITDQVCWQGTWFELVDTGGISLQPSTDLIQERVRQIALSLISSSDLILFVCDGNVGISPEDQEIAKYLHKQGKKIVLVINKIDSEDAHEREYEFVRLGFKDMFGISAQHGRGIAELLEHIATTLKDVSGVAKSPEPGYKVALLGMPNVGKSSLMNLLLKQERSIVADIPGTTREAISEPIRFYKETLQLTDTPGVRRKRSIDEPIENLMVKSALRAVEQADIILLMIDGSQMHLSNQELKLAFYAFENKKAIILLINKDDLLDEQQHKELQVDFDAHRTFLRKIPHLYISCKSGENIGKVLPLVREVWERHNQKFADVHLSELLKGELKNKPLYHNTKMLYLRKVKQVKSAPITILLYVNVPEWFGESQLAFFENLLRAKYDLKGVPVQFLVRKS